MGGDGQSDTPYLNGGSTLERLNRIERLLERMDDKLDLKAERADLQQVAVLVEARLQKLELWQVGEVAMHSEMLPRFREAEATIKQLYEASLKATASAEEAKQMYAKQGFKLDTTAKKIAAMATIAFVILNTLDTISNLLHT